LVAHCVWVAGVGSSNLPSPTLLVESMRIAPRGKSLWGLSFKIPRGRVTTPTPPPRRACAIVDATTTAMTATATLGSHPTMVLSRSLIGFDPKTLNAT
jgi:hypothetical protein